MTSGQWRVTVLLVAIATGLSILLSLDAGHTVALVTVGFVGGIINSILDSLDVDRLPALSVPPRTRGLAEVQSLEFSLHGKGTSVGSRAVNLLADVTQAALESRRLDPHGVGGPLGAVLAVRTGMNPPGPVDSRTFDAAMGQLEQILRADPHTVPGRRRVPEPARDSR